ncbi:intercompartmental signaling factor BofC [Cytobacillus sp. S13-E01]|uniref:intercompartmental signaling factor BofC n=1 Tax=Cytobacillus sp. S13-E01 TaxID=3031326 RepID=UPI0023D80C8E|nr:intercompartmental signaling factor BofC [Cytobacillus sp. S13-E01]MDF0726788.1 intercompartmental signaling factor BofC [Cytobacillus sp. S13-E01]
MKKLINRVTIWTAIILLPISLSNISFSESNNNGAEINALLAASDKVHEVNGPLTVTVILERQYMDGEVSEEIVEETIWSMEDFWAQYENWQLVHQDEEQVVFQQKIDDISPLLKSNGYFGITDDGVLSIFEGKPDKSTKVIQSFFQIDIEKLESHQHNQLKEGIRVDSKDHYVNIIETFKTFSATPISKTSKD